QRWRRRPLELPDALEESLITRVSPRALQDGEGVRNATLLIDAKPGQGGGGRAAVLAVVAMDVEGAGQFADRLGDLQGLLPRDSAVSDRDVHVPQPVLLGLHYLRPSPVHGDHCLDTELPQGLKRFVPFWAAAADDLVADAEDVVQPLRLQLRRGGHRRLLP